MLVGFAKLLKFSKNVIYAGRYIWWLPPVVRDPVTGWAKGSTLRPYRLKKHPFELGAENFRKPPKKYLTRHIKSFTGRRS